MASKQLFAPPRQTPNLLSNFNCQILPSQDQTAAPNIFICLNTRKEPCLSHLETFVSLLASRKPPQPQPSLAQSELDAVQGQTYPFLLCLVQSQGHQSFLHRETSRLQGSSDPTLQLIVGPSGASIFPASCIAAPLESSQTQNAVNRCPKRPARQVPRGSLAPRTVPNDQNFQQGE